MPPPSNQVYGIDTSVFLRLLTGHPEKEFEAASRALETLFERQPTAELVVSNQVIGESYITLQHHYKLSKSHARDGIRQFLEDGPVSPLNGAAVLDLLSQKGGAGLMDRLIVQDYQAKGFPVLTNDLKMSKLPGALKLAQALPDAVLPVRDLPESVLREWIDEDETDGEAIRKRR
ncbi:MAG: PIN domain-containing protein [Opitutales bacterium]|nr:PIN domain-containing protein [Opitutales bacterium]